MCADEIGERSRRQIPEELLSPKLRLVRAHQDQIPELQKVYMAGQYLVQWTGQTMHPEDISRNLVAPELPPGGVKEHFVFMSISLREHEH